MVDRSWDLTSLTLLIAVQEQGSVASAAAVVGLAQPTASERLSRLERRLGLSLLERAPGGTTTTEDGARVVAWARDLLAAAERFDGAVEGLRQGPVRPASLAASYTIAEHLFPAWLAGLGGGMIGRIDLQVANSRDVVSAVRAGAADLGFIESGQPPGGMRSEVVGHDELVLVAWPDHPWTRRREPLAPAQLGGQPLVLREVGSGTREALEEALSSAEVAPPRIEMQLGSNTAVLGAVLGRVAPTFASRLAARSHLDSGALVTVAVDGLDLRRPLHAIWTGPRPSGTAGALLDRALSAGSAVM